MSLLLTVDRQADDPVWKQIANRVVTLVDDGTLVAGSRLPPSRTLAGTLGVNRSTVCRAYEELWALGYLESRQGSYSTVRGRARPLSGSRVAAPPLVDWDRACAPGVRDACRRLAASPRPAAAGTGRIDFANLTADTSLCPVDDLRRAVRHVLLQHGASLLDYGEPAGYAPLREVLARRLRGHGVTVSPDEILITHGAQQALELVLTLVARPGASIAIEVPTYALILPLLQVLDLRAVEIPLLPDGLDLQALEAAFSREPPALLYTMPNFQNPTGITTSQAHRERLLSLCEAHAVPILEDGFEEEMKYFGKAVLPIKSMDRHGIVIYVGTFSKVIFPGLRVGWIAADRECIRRLVALNRCSILSGSTLDQAAVHRFCEAGHYEKYLRRLHTVYRRRMQMLLKCLKLRMPAGRVAWTEPVGGCTLWLRVNGARASDEAKIVERAHREGVAVTPGSHFFSTPQNGVGFRLSIAKAKVHEIDEGCRRLARAIRG
ncbi:MAG TPA: PLP-dependent aminotransferase family protein [Vicinamibacterales bacterium]|jgi:DNA-binding transcriptional MocR family regulator